MMVRLIETSEELKSAVSEAGSKMVIIQFYANWCDPCKMIAPQFELFEKEFENVIFLKLDVDVVEDPVHEYNIMATPTFVFLKNAEKIDDFMGANADRLLGLIKKHANSSTL